MRAIGAGRHSTFPPVHGTLGLMPAEPDAPLDLLWKEYGRVFNEFDDLTLARWMAQTLGQFEGKAWRLSHPLVGAYRLVAQLGHERQIWFKRLATPPAAYAESPCCRAPGLPLLTRDVQEAGLICQHCNDTLVAFEEIPEPIRKELRQWAAEYSPIHAIAHEEESPRPKARPERELEQAAAQAERLLVYAGTHLAPQLLEWYPAVIWEDQDECLEVRPEDVRVSPGGD